MSRTKGTPKTGGRKAGTPNKASKEVKEWINELLTNGRDKFEQALLQVSPDEYLRHYMGLLSYVTPKMQAVSVDAVLDAEYKNLERLIDSAPDEIVDEIAKRVIKLQKEYGKQAIS